MFFAIKTIIRTIKYQFGISRGTGETALRLLDIDSRDMEPVCRAELIESIVSRTLRAGRLFGMLNTCLTRSVVFARLIREQGYEARVIFGLNKGENILSGHCWVVWPERPTPGIKDSNYQIYYVYPEPDKYPGWTPE